MELRYLGEKESLINVIASPSPPVILRERSDRRISLRTGSARQSPDPELLNFLIEQGKVVRVSEDIVFAASAYEEMVARVTDYIKSHGKITVAEVRDIFKTSRKYALAMMEYLDAQKITRRVGDERVLR